MNKKQSPREVAEKLAAEFGLRRWTIIERGYEGPINDAQYEVLRKALPEDVMPWHYAQLQDGSGTGWIQFHISFRGDS